MTGFTAMKVPLAPLDHAGKRLLARAMIYDSPGHPDFDVAAAHLWLHLCHQAGVTPGQVVEPDAPMFRRMMREWQQVAETIRPGLPTQQLEFIRATAGRASRAYDRALEERAKALFQAPALLDEAEAC